MDFRPLAFLAVFVALPAVSLLYAWRKNRDSRHGPSWRDKQYDCAMQEALAREPFLNSDGPYLTREEAHDRQRLR
jgi:hypothetical protein